MKQTLFLLTFLCSTLGAEQPPRSYSKPYDERQLQNMQHTLSNQDQEIAILRQKVANFETVLDSMHKEVSSLVTAAKDAQKKATNAVDVRLKAIEKNIDKLVTDLKAFKKQANEVASSISDVQKKIKEQEEITSLQAQQIKDLEHALRTLASAMQTKTAKTSKLHIVKSGENLEKIAKEYSTSIDAIRAENNLSKDTIRPGQKLTIP
jgi:LysM repeat protein